MKESFAIGSFDLVRKFVEYLVAKNATEALEDSRTTIQSIDWETVEASAAHSRSFAQTIGRAVVIADQMSRGVFSDLPCEEAAPNADPFFPFSVADVIPDFGDDRYRTRVARKVARIFGTRRAVILGS